LPSLTVFFRVSQEVEVIDLAAEGEDTPKSVKKKAKPKPTVAPMEETAETVVAETPSADLPKQ
jgi:hypothetical protein